MSTRHKTSDETYRQTQQVRGDLAGSPGQEEVSNAKYDRQRLQYIGHESSPSAGWRTVYYVMGVSVR